MRIVIKREDGGTTVDFKAENDEEARDLKDAIIESLHPVGSGKYYTMPDFESVSDALDRRGY